MLDINPFYLTIDISSRIKIDQCKFFQDYLQKTVIGLVVVYEHLDIINVIGGLIKKFGELGFDHILYVRLIFSYLVSKLIVLRYSRNISVNIIFLVNDERVPLVVYTIQRGFCYE